MWIGQWADPEDSLLHEVWCVWGSLCPFSLQTSSSQIRPTADFPKSLKCQQQSSRELLCPAAGTVNLIQAAPTNCFWEKHSLYPQVWMTPSCRQCILLLSGDMGGIEVQPISSLWFDAPAHLKLGCEAAAQHGAVTPWTTCFHSMAVSAAFSGSPGLPAVVLSMGLILRFCSWLYEYSSTPVKTIQCQMNVKVLLFTS